MNSLVNCHVIQQMVDAVVAAVNPQQVILFGSYGRDLAQPHSDIDFLVITKDIFGPHHSRRKETAKVWQALAKFGIPTDVLIYSTDEIAQWHQSPNHIIARALQEGKILYERSSARPAIDGDRPAGSESTSRNAG